MPLSKYDIYFHGGAAKTHTSMLRQYGKAKGEQVFYATKNKKKSLLRRRERE